jgi:MFS transporter, PAT family, beta-lactamase induction signal transducer AmpG
MASRSGVPVWLMGLTNLTYGLFGGVVAFAIPQLLSSRHIAESEIAGITAVSLTPGFWAFLFSPMLDVRFSRRWYSVVLAIVTAVSVVVVFLCLDHLVLLEVVLTLGFFAAYLYQSALSGWLSTIVATEEEGTLSVWITIANVGGFGIMAICCNQMVRHLAPLTVALLLGGSILLPTLAFPFMRAPGPNRRLARESFVQFNRDLLALVKRREVLIAVILFIAPSGTFALTNFLGSRGDDFHASSGLVGIIGGVGGAAAGIVGCLLFKPLSRLMPLRPLYLAVGLIGSIFTLSFILLPHVPVSFAALLMAENVFQSLAITTSVAIMFEVLGRDNPLASTTFCFIGSAYGVPISYMLYVDAFGFTRGGIAGSLAIDALCGIVASVLLGTMLLWLTRSQAAIAEASQRKVAQT